MESHKTKNTNVRKYDYETFLNELDSVSHSLKIKKGSKEIELNHCKGYKYWDFVTAPYIMSQNDWLIIKFYGDDEIIG